jgi:DNA-binding MarR family transcriptional regulator
VSRPRHPSPPELDLATWLSLAGAAVDAHVLDSLHVAGLTGLRPGHGFVVQRLVDGPATVGEIATTLAVSQQAVSKTVRELVDLGYAEQREDPADRRRRPVRLTRRGRRAVLVARQARASVAAEVAARVGDDDVSAALRVARETADVLGIAGRVRRRAVAPPPDRS